MCQNLIFLKKTLKNHNQGQLLAFCDQLNPQQRQVLLSQIASLDLSEVDRWVENYIKKPASVCIPSDFQPAEAYFLTPKDENQARKYDDAKKLGENLISSGKTAAFVVAGGQGTRLGFDGPKGNFPITPVRNKTLFQFFAETIEAASKKYKTVLPWYIMTSPLNHQQTLDLFKKNGFFGLDEKNIFIFMQGSLPNFSFDGKILFADKSTIACSPDGHGGSLKALYKSGAVDNMKKRGVEYISYFQVDNPLTNIFDPLFIGLHALENSQMSSKALIKNNPKEKVGNFCLVDGKVTVIEYSDLPDELAEKRNPDGSLVFELGSIAIHIINRTFVEKLNSKGFQLPLHKAVKKIPHIDQNGNPVIPQKPNGIKLESFVFDALPMADNSIILETKREQEFGPVKNAEGTDSAQTARDMLIARAADWLKSVGISVPQKPDGSPDCIIEIAPGFAIHKEDAAAKKDRIPEIKPKDKVYIA